MSPKNFKLAKEIELNKDFQVLDSTETNFHSTIYTCLKIEEKDDQTLVHCTFQHKQNGQIFTETTWFPGGTKVRSVNEKALNNVESGKTFRIKRSKIRYIIIYKTRHKVSCVIINGPLEDIGKVIVFQKNKVVVDIADPVVNILNQLNMKDLFIMKDPKNLSTYILLRVSKKRMHNFWNCIEVFPANGKKHKLLITTPTIKIG